MARKVAFRKYTARLWIYAWDQPDTGNYLTLNHMLGGGIPVHDAQFLNNIVSFIKQHQQEEPWCLVASFVNPHVYIAQHYDVEENAGYGPDDDLNHIPMPLQHNC
jgi:hypothetical protein